MAQKLTDIKLKALKPKERIYKVTDGAGLYVDVFPSGLIVWRYQYLLNGKRQKVTIGPYREAGATDTRIVIGLKKARDDRNEYKKLVQAGISPAKRKQEDKISAKVAASSSQNFRKLAERWFAEENKHKSDSWRYTIKGWLELDIFPALGDREPRSINESDIREIIKKIEKRGSPTSANKVRVICKHIFAYAKRAREVDINPVLDVQMVNTHYKKSHRALGWEEIGPFLKALKLDAGSERNKLAIRLLMLTLTRKDELRLSKITEFDFANRVWSIPAHRMKMRDPHKIYLSTQAIEILTQLIKLACGSEYLLPHFSTLSRPMGHTTINSVIDRIDIGGARFVPHGFRATASSILNEAGKFSPDVIERALAHKNSSVRSIYNQAQYVPERTMMLQWWADYLDSLELGNMIIPSLFTQSA